MNFGEWQVELAAGHTSHVKYHDWLDERIRDNRRLTREAEALEEEQQRDKRLLAKLMQGWGNGLNKTTISKATMSKDKETRSPLRIVDEESSAPAPAEEQLKDPTTSADGPLLSDSIPPGTPLLPGTVTTFPQDFNQEGTESDRSDLSIGSNAGVDPTSKSFGSDADMELDYNGTSSEEESPTSKDQPMTTEPKGTPPGLTEPINQSI